MRFIVSCAPEFKGMAARIRSPCDKGAKESCLLSMFPAREFYGPPLARWSCSNDVRSLSLGVPDRICCFRVMLLQGGDPFRVLGDSITQCKSSFEWDVDHHSDSTLSHRNARSNGNSHNHHIHLLTICDVARGGVRLQRGTPKTVFPFEWQCTKTTGSII